MAVPIRSSGTNFEALAPIPLFVPGGYGAENVELGLQYQVARDDRFLINTLVDDPTPRTLVVNWSPR